MACLILSRLGKQTAQLAILITLSHRLLERSTDPRTNLTLRSLAFFVPAGSDDGHIYLVDWMRLVNLDPILGSAYLCSVSPSNLCLFERRWIAKGGDPSLQSGCLGVWPMPWRSILRRHAATVLAC